MAPRQRGTIGAWTVASGTDHASRAQARIVPGNGRSGTEPRREADGSGERPGRFFRWSERGFAALQRRLQGTASPPAATLVVLEATGTYWVGLAVALHEAG